MSGIARHHSEWLSLIEVSGPFLTLPVLVRVFPQGLPKVDGKKLGRLRAAFEEWANAQDAKASDANALHATWVQLVLGELLEFDDQTLRSGDGLPSGLDVPLAEHHETLRPSRAIVEPSGRTKAGAPRLLVAVWPSNQDLESAVPAARWAASPLERMTQLCRSAGVRLGLVTNGERWTVVDAPVGQTAGYASWYAGLWLQEPITLAAFEALLGVRRFFAVADTDTIEALLDESVAFQQEVTDQLGYQVRRAVEVLVQALDRADLDRKRELLRDVPPARLYDAALTVMMRLVFLFCAEERGLLLLGDETYDANYAVSTLRALLREEADRVGVEVLERRQDAWARLLATFRAVHGGVEHEALRLPALGGSLFDPDRFPFLEGRAAGTSWLATPASPLPIDNRTVLHLLEALQLLRTRGDGGTSEARKLSYRALDIEQIGHVYEGLLDHVAVRVDTDTLGLLGTKDKEPELSLDELNRERRHGTDGLIGFLKEHTGRSTSALRNDLEAELDEGAEQRLLVACGNDKALVKHIAPYHALIRKDVWGYPQIYRAGSFMVTGGSERRQTGTHYTPKSLTEQIVTETLEPLVYVGPAEGKPRDAWTLRSAVELLDLKICDMAMGSGAFLVQVCRWLAERVVEAWEEAERQGAAISADGEVLEKAGGRDLLPPDREERLSFARGLVAERCVYGVDINPMAVELAKLSLWLVTLAKGRPFGFLDHNLRSGDSLLGITSLEQLENFHLDPVRGTSLHHTLFDPRHEIRVAVTKALELRQRLRAIRILDIEDVRAMERLDGEAKAVLRRAELAADLLIGGAIATIGMHEQGLDSMLVELADSFRPAITPGPDVRRLDERARELLDTDCPERLRPRRPFHWAIEFPELFISERCGFDAIVGNPPFLGGKRITGATGQKYRDFLVKWLAGGTRGSADLVSYFFLRAFGLLKQNGTMGLLAVNTIAEGDTRKVGLESMTNRGAVIYSAYPNEQWPGSAAVAISRIHVRKGPWHGTCRLHGSVVAHVSPFLTGDEDRLPQRLAANRGKAFVGTLVHGSGFLISEDEAQDLLSKDPRNRDVVFPYLNGQDVNSDPNQRPSRWVINFWDWPEARARTYHEAYSLVRKRAKPERDKLDERTTDNKKYKKHWWLHGRQAKDLYHAIGRGQLYAEHPTDWRPGATPLRSVILIPETTKYCAFHILPNDAVFSHMVKVVASDSFDLFGVLSSTLHEVWARKNSSTLETRLKYVPTDAFETFAQPERVLSNADIPRDFLALRKRVMGARELGLTKLYNELHDPSLNANDLLKLREMIVTLDQLVLAAYGWTDVMLDHDFHTVAYLPENDRVRFTISESARHEVLRRLAELNHSRYEEEVREGLRGPVETGLVDLQAERRRRASSGRMSGVVASASYAQSDFAFEEAPRQVAEAGAAYDPESGAARQIREWLAAHRGWHAKEEIISGARVRPDEWPLAIKELVDGGAVAKQGERRGTKYKAKQP